ncbi:MAG: YrdB family protein [Cytophagaceae bacterium]
MIIAINSFIVFSLELIMLYAFARYGYSLGEGIQAYFISALFLAIAITIWALWAAPKSKRRLAMPFQAFLRVFMFGLGALCLYLLGMPTWAIVVFFLAVITQWLGWMTNSN